VGSLEGRKVGHFPDMASEDDPAKARIVRIVNQHDPAKSALPERVSAWRIAKLAGTFE
jgi:hypothetical protein